MTGRSLIPKPRWALRKMAESRGLRPGVGHFLGPGLTNFRVALALGQTTRRLVDRDQHRLGLGMIGVVLDDRGEKLPGLVGQLQVQAPQSQLHAFVGIAIGKLCQPVLISLANRVE